MLLSVRLVFALFSNKFLIIQKRKKTCYKIEQIFNGFLWSGKEGNASRAKVGWKSLYLPREEGGLGLRRVKDWNDATIMKHIWNLFYRKDSIWGSLG